MKKKIFLITLIALAIALCFAITSFADEAAPKPGLKIEAASLSFEDSVYVLYAVSHEGIETSDVRMLLWSEPRLGTEDYTVGTEDFTASATKTPATIKGKSCAVFKNTCLRAKNMSDYVYARAYAVVDGVEYYSEVSKYSILQYAYNMLGYTATPADSEAFRNMLNSMLQYGADAQIYFGHSTERLANSDFYQINVVDGTLEDGFTKGLYTHGESATLTANQPQEGYEFIGWTDTSGDLISESTTLLIDEFTKNETYTATYREIPVHGTITEAPLPHYSYAESDEGIYNSELFYQNSFDISLGDPTVLPVEEDGEMWFYVTGTTSAVFELFKTRDFTKWYSVGSIFTPSESFFGVESFWAPQLIYDPDASWSYYLGKDAGEGHGLYILFFSARDENKVCKLAVAFSKTVDGKYKTFEGVNANGDYIDASVSLFEMEELQGLGLYADHAYGDLYKPNRSFIDASPFVDPVSGEKYLYMVRSRNVDTSNDVWGVKMKDWVTPDYSTTAPLTSNGYTTIEKTERYGYISKNNIDEGPFLYYKDATDDGIDNGKYYLTFSVGDTDDKLYPVCQAVGDSPLGPFTKVQPDEGGFVSCPEDLWDIHGTGHHAFFELNGELYMAYHSYNVNSEAEAVKRYFHFNKVEWAENGGELLMRANGPAKAISPLPSGASGYQNVALGSSVLANGENSPLLTDGLVALRDGEESMLFTFDSDTEIVLSFEEWVSARAILIYNSYDYSTAFESIDRIEFSYRRLADGNYYYGKAYIENLGFNFSMNLVPDSYLTAKGESGAAVLRPMGAAIAEFDELEVNEVKLYFNASRETAISEIVLLGKSCESTDITEGRGEIAASFEPYTKFTGESYVPDNEDNNLSIKVDGNLTEDVWTKYATVMKIDGVKLSESDLLIYGERSAEVFVYIGEDYIYFAFDVKDKNLFFNPADTQGQNTAVEIYFTSAENDVFNSECYSVRINPTGKSGSASCNLGVYYADKAQNNWVLFSVLPEIFCSAVVDGTVVTSINESTNPDNVGYTVEIAIDKAFIGDDADSMKFTASFVQDRIYEKSDTVKRLGNTFISGTHYLRPATWVQFTNKEVSEEEPEPIPMEYTASLSADSFVYNGNPHKPDVTVLANGTPLTPDTDYELIYSDNVYAGTATVTVVLKGEHSGTLTKSFTIEKMQLEKPSADSTVFTYNGSNQTYYIPKSEYYTVSGNVKLRAGTYAVLVSLDNTENCEWSDGSTSTVTYRFVIAPLAVNATLSVADIVIGQTPLATVNCSSFSITEGIDYDIDLGDYSAVTDRAVATLTFKGNFTGSISTYYRVKSISEGTDALLDFNYDITDRTGNHTTEIIGRDPIESYSSSAYHNTAGSAYTGAFNAISYAGRIIKINDVALGTKDFTMFVSAAFFLDQIPLDTNQANALIESSAHLEYKCDGTNKNNCPICNGASMAESELDFISVSLVRNNTSGTQYPYRLRVQIGKGHIAYSLTDADVRNWIGENGEIFMDVAVSVDRQYAVSGATDITRVIVYVNGEQKAYKDFSLDVDQILGSDEIYLGGTLQWSSGGLTERNRRLNTFLLYDGVLSESQIDTYIYDYITENDKNTDWWVDDLTIDSSRTAYDSVLGNCIEGTIRIGAGQYLTGGAVSLASAYSGVRLIPGENEGEYIFRITADAAKALSSQKIALRYGDTVKSFTFTYQSVTSLEIEDITVYEFSIDSANPEIRGKHYFTVYDQDGNPIDSISLYSEDFGEYGCEFGRGDEPGEYYISFSYNDALEYLGGICGKSISVTATYASSVSGTFFVNIREAAVNDHESFTMNNKSTSTYKSYDVSLEKRDWTIAFRMLVPNITGSETVDIFTTTGRDSAQGLTFSIKRESSTMWSARVRINGTTYWHKGISVHNFIGEELDVAIEIDWADDGQSVRTRVYYNGVENTPTGSGYPKQTENTLDYVTTAVSGHTPEQKLTFGSFNSSLAIEDGGTVNNVSNGGIKNYNIEFIYVVVVEGHLAGEILEAFADNTQ